MGAQDLDGGVSRDGEAIVFLLFFGHYCIKCHTEQDSEQDSIPGTTFRTTFRPSVFSLLIFIIYQ